MTAIDPVIQRRMEIAQSQWPSLTSASACLDCNFIFAFVEQDGSCPFCQSRSVMDIAGRLNQGVVGDAAPMRRMRLIVSQLDEVLDGIVEVARLNEVEEE